MRAKIERIEKGFLISLSDGRNCYFLEHQAQWKCTNLPSRGKLFFCPGICDLGFIKIQIEHLAGEEKVRFFF